MPYLIYNLPLHRTGFRPVGQTNTWAATQLSGVGAGERRIFSAWGGMPLRAGRHLGQVQRGFSPMVLGMRGLGQAPAICLDQNQNTISCLDPNCTFGDCGSTGPQQTVGALCLDHTENAIDCTSPNCMFGDCSGPANIPQKTAAGTAPSLSPGPAPRVSAPLTMFPPTAPPTATPSPILVSSSSAWTQYLPFIAIAAVLVLAMPGGKK